MAVTKVMLSFIRDGEPEYVEVLHLVGACHGQVD